MHILTSWMDSDSICLFAASTLHAGIILFGEMKVDVHTAVGYYYWVDGIGIPRRFSSRNLELGLSFQRCRRWIRSFGDQSNAVDAPIHQPTRDKHMKTRFQGRCRAASRCALSSLPMVVADNQRPRLSFHDLPGCDVPLMRSL